MKLLSSPKRLISDFSCSSRLQSLSRLQRLFVVSKWHCITGTMSAEQRSTRKKYDDEDVSGSTKQLHTCRQCFNWFWRSSNMVRTTGLRGNIYSNIAKTSNISRCNILPCFSVLAESAEGKSSGEEKSGPPVQSEGCLPSPRRDPIREKG